MLSVVVPVYNGENYIEETLNYIMASAYEKIEIIVVDDGSLDRSGEIVQKLAQNDRRIRYYQKENGGIVSARNYGMEKASGRYICFVDQDDWVKPEMFQMLIDDMEKYHADFAQGGVGHTMIEADASDKKRLPFLLKNGTESYRKSYGALIVRGDRIRTDAKVDCNVWNKVYSLDFLRKNQINFRVFLDYEDDWLFVIQAMKSAEVVTVREQIIYVWRQNNESESRNRIVHDKYLSEFYEKHCALRRFLLEAVQVANLEKKISEEYEAELQKETLLWGLSNETGRGIENRAILDSVKVMKDIVCHEKENGIKKGLFRKPLPISVYGQRGVKRIYCALRDIGLTFLLLNHMEHLAVVLNKKLLHGRWHN